MRQMTIDQTLAHPGGFGVKQSETHVFFIIEKTSPFCGGFANEGAPEIERVQKCSASRS